MELRQLRYFVSTVRCGSVKAAAHHNYVTPPAISIQLRLLEEELGEKLLVADRRGIRLTEAGEAVLEQATDILRRADGLKQSLGPMQRGESGMLRMGAIDAASIYVLPQIFQEYRNAYAGIDLQVVVTDSAQLLVQLERGDIELAIVTLPLSPQASQRCRVVSILEEELLVVAHPSHELCRSRRASLAEVGSAGLITYLPRSTTRHLINGIFADNGEELHAVMEISSPEAMRTLAEAGLGASILPRSVVVQALREKTLKHVRLPKSIRFSRQLGVVFRERILLSPAARLFLALLGDHLGCGNLLDQSNTHLNNPQKEPGNQSEGKHSCREREVQ